MENCGRIVRRLWRGCVRIMGGLSEDWGSVVGGLWFVGGLEEDCGKILAGFWEDGRRNSEGCWED